MNITWTNKAVEHAENWNGPVYGVLTISQEGNTLSIDQITALWDEKRVVGDPREIREVQNAIQAYSLAGRYKPDRTADLLQAHGILMDGLIPDAGRFRSTNVGIIKGSQVNHIAPKPSMIPKLIDELFTFLKKDKETPRLIKACAFHYELEFIHPFSDGNGRTGRLWQYVILLPESPAFSYVPVESIIKSRQEAYYKALSVSDRAGNSTTFIEFCLTALRDGLEEFLTEVRVVPLTGEERLSYASSHFGESPFARKEYMDLFKTISTATASRDLALGVEIGKLKKTGEKNRARYVFK